jgi:hypothetical protein
VGGVKGGVERVLQGLECKGQDGTGQAQREEKMKAVDRSAVQEDEEEESGCGSIYNVDSPSSLSPFFPLSFLPSLLPSLSASFPLSFLSLLPSLSPSFPLCFLPSLLASPNASIRATSPFLSAPCPLHSTWRTALG